MHDGDETLGDPADATTDRATPLPPPGPPAGSPSDPASWVLPEAPPSAPLPYGPSGGATPPGPRTGPTAPAPPPGWAPPPAGPGATVPGGPPAPGGWAPPLPVYGAAPPPPPGAPVTKARSRVALAILSVTAVLAATTFAVVALTRPDGSASAEEAVQHLFDAIEQEDAIGVMESLPPGEREVLLDPLVATVGELQRLGLLGSFALEDVPGADIEVEGLTLQSTRLGSGITKVRVTGGTITATVIPDQVPIGPRTRELAEREGESVDIRAESSTESLADSNLELVAIEEDGGWHVSLFYTIAEYARGDDEPVPQFGSGAIAPVGSDSPEGAVRGLVEAGIALDLARAVGHLPPDEMRVLYDYVPLFLDEADEVADGARSDGYHASLDRLDLHAEGDGDTRRVVIDAVALSGGSDDTTMSYSWDGSCTVMEATAPSYERVTSIDTDGGYREPEPARTSTIRVEVCTDGRISATEDGAETNLSVNGPWGRGDMASGPLGPVFPFGPDTRIGEAITVVEHDGQWYVSPVRTLSDSILSSLRGLDGSEIDELFAGFLGSSRGARFEPVGRSIDEYPAGTMPGGTIPMPNPDNPYVICSEQVYGKLGNAPAIEDFEAAEEQFERCLAEHGEEPVAHPSGMYGALEIVGDHVLGIGDDHVIAYAADGSVAFTGPTCEDGSLVASTPANDATTVAAVCGDELVGVDGTTGAELWRTPHDETTSPVQGPTAVLTSGGGTVSVLDLATGAERWSVTADHPAHVTLDDTGVYLDDGTETTAYDLTTGEPRWSVPQKLTMLDSVPGALLVRTHSGIVRRLDPATGATVWSSEPAGPLVGKALGVGATADVALVMSIDSSRTVEAYDLATGARLWTRDGIDEFVGVRAGANAVVVADDASGVLLALDPRTGQDAPGAIAADVWDPFVVEGNVVAFIAESADGSFVPQMVTLP